MWIIIFLAIIFLLFIIISNTNNSDRLDICQIENLTIKTDCDEARRNCYFACLKKKKKLTEKDYIITPPQIMILDQDCYNNCLIYSPVC